MLNDASSSLARSTPVSGLGVKYTTIGYSAPPQFQRRRVPSEQVPTDTEKRQRIVVVHEQRHHQQLQYHCSLFFSKGSSISLEIRFAFGAHTFIFSYLCYERDQFLHQGRPLVMVSNMVADKKPVLERPRHASSWHPAYTGGTRTSNF